MTRNWDLTTVVASATLVGFFSSQVLASGFQKEGQNATNLGLAYSGTAALAEDASTAYYNAAGLARIEDSQLVLGGALIHQDSDFSSLTVTSPNGATLANEDADSDESMGFPFLHVAKRLDDKWVLGLSVAPAVGLATEYDNDSIVRYLATETKLKTLNFSPSVAYQVLPCLSLAVGADAQFARAQLSTRVGTTGDLLSDGGLKNKIEGWGYGWHAGALWQPLADTRVGLHFRSYVRLRLQGNTEYSSFGDPFATYTAHTRINLPDTVTLSLYQGLNPMLALTADLAWSNWSRFDALRLRYASGAQDLGTDTIQNFRDAYRAALGLIYTHNSNWLLRAGLAFESTPTKSEYRTVRIPDSDRIWAAIGGAYTFNQKWRLDFGYAHLFFKNTDIDDKAPFIANTQNPISLATLTGDNDAAANVVGIQIRYDFV